MKPPPQSWQVLSLVPAVGLEEILAAFLFERGAVGTQQIEERLLVYFPEPCAIADITDGLQIFLKQLRAGGINLPGPTITHEPLAAQDTKIVNISLDKRLAFC